MPSYSAIINNYNYQQFLPEAIESALHQTLPAKEVIVVDDGSTDDSVALVQKQFGDRIQLIASENRGQLSAFLLGYQAASGDYVAFLDADDRWHSDHLATADRVINDGGGANFIIANCEYFGLSAGPYWNGKQDLFLPDTRHALFSREWIGNPTSSLVIERELLSFLSTLSPATIAEWRLRADDVLVYGGSALGGRKYRLARPTVSYRHHGTNGFCGVTRTAEQQQAYDDQVTRLLEHFLALSGYSKAHLGAEVFAQEVYNLHNPIRFRRRALRRLWRLGVISMAECAVRIADIHLASMLNQPSLQSPHRRAS